MNIFQSSSSSPPSNDFFQQLADGAPVMIWMSGTDMGCFYFNRAWLDFRGRTTEQEAGNGWAEGVHPEDVQRCISHYAGCFERRMAFAMTYRLRSAAGEYVWMLDRGAAHYSPDGTFLGFFGGCAEIESKSPVIRNAELSSSLRDMQEFTRRLAIFAAYPHSVDKTDVLVPGFAPSSHPSQDEQLRLLRHATNEITQLTVDMAAHQTIPRGACIP